MNILDIVTEKGTLSGIQQLSKYWPLSGVRVQYNSYRVWSDELSISIVASVYLDEIFLVFGEIFYLMVKYLSKYWAYCSYCWTFRVKSMLYEVASLYQIADISVFVQDNFFPWWDFNLKFLHWVYDDVVIWNQ